VNCTSIVRHKTNNGGAVFYMAKYTFEDKLWAVIEYEKEPFTIAHPLVSLIIRQRGHESPSS
jgi:hypothetical protein